MTTSQKPQTKKEYDLIYRAKNADRLRKYRHDRYYKNVEEARRKSREWQRAHPYRKYRKYGTDVEALAEKQQGRCAICKREEKLCVDHLGSKIRGLLCRRCNAALGLLKESVTIVAAALDYLKK